MLIRPARADEAGAVHEIVQAAYHHYIARIGRPPGPMGDDYAALVAAGRVWVAEHAGAIAGILVLEALPDGAMLLDNVAVVPAAQGQGLGRALVGFAAAEASRRGARVLRLYTHVLMVENIALYSRLGFVETARLHEKGFDRVYMEKPI